MSTTPLAAGQFGGGRFVVLPGDSREGGMATVYRAQDVRTDEVVALKVLHDVHQVSSVDRFHREATLLAGLAHPAIVRYIDHGVSSRGEPYLAMEWLEGPTLDEHLRAGRLTLPSTLRIGRRILEALSIIHSKEIVHRDIKPNNLLLPGGDLGQIKILDFGIARQFLDAARVITSVDAAAGTPMYMSPEQINGQAALDGRSDIFSVGCVLFECLTGNPPYSAETASEVLVRILSGPEVSFETLGLPDFVSSVLKRMISRAADGRPRSAAELALELDGIGEALPAIGYPSGGRHAHDSARRQPRRLAVAEERLEAMLVVAQVPETLGQLAQFPTMAASTWDAPSPLEPQSADADRHGEVTVRKIAEQFGAAVTPGPTGMMFLVFRGGTPTDLAGKTARCALAVKSSVATAAVALTLGRRGAGDELVGEGVRLLLRAGRPGVVVNPLAGTLLQAGFELGGPATDQLLFEKGGREAPRTILGKASPCVGRDRELSSLSALWSQCSGDSVCRAMLITGPPGAGKTRLRLELLDRLREGGESFEYLVGRGDLVRSGAPYAVLGAALRAAAGISGGESPEVQRKRLVQHVQRHVPPDRTLRVAAFLGEIAGIYFPDDQLPSLRAARQDPRVMADQTMVSWLDFLDAVSAHRPVLVVLEDLHWGDAPSVQLVDAALRTFPDRPLLVLAFARPEVDNRFPKLWRERDLQRLALPPLTGRAAQRLVSHILGELPAARLSWIVDRAEGNPFHLEELVRAVAESSQEADAPLDLPETVVGMVQARLDALGPDAKRVLRAASVYGQTFRAAGLQALVDDSPEDLGRWLEILGQREIIYSRQTGASHEYLFRHAVLQDAAYRMLTSHDRLAAHRMAGEYLVSAGEHDAILLVHHFELGGENQRASYWCRFAAQQALDANDLVEVVARAARGAELGAEGQDLGVLRLLEAQARWWLAEYVQAEQAAREALRLGNSATRTAAIGELAAALGQQTRFDEVLGLAQDLADARPSDGDDGLASWLNACYRVALCLFPAGRPDRAEEMLRVIESGARAEPIVTGRLDGLRARVAYAQGRLGEARTFYEAAVAAFEEAGDLRSSTEYLVNLGNDLCELGQLEQAHRRLTAALALGERMNLGPVILCSLLNLTSVEVYRRNSDLAADLGKRAADLARDHGDLRMLGLIELYLARNAQADGDYLAAERHAHDAINAFQGVPAMLSTATASLARAVLGQSRTGDALALAERAQELVGVHGLPEEGEALISLVLVEALLATGDVDRARSALTAAWATVQRKAAAIDDPDGRSSFIDRIPDHLALRALVAQP